MSDEKSAHLGSPGGDQSILGGIVLARRALEG